jgi:hypothetical protein
VAFFGKEIDPVGKALVQDPPGFLVISMSEQLLGLAAVITGIVVGGTLGYLCFIKPDPSGTDVFHQKIEHG